MEAKLLTAQRFVDPDTGCSCRYVYSDTEFFRPHYHDYFELFLMLEGQTLHMVNDTQISLSKGCLVFIRPEDRHDYLSIQGKAFSFLNIPFTARTCRELFAYLGPGFPGQSLLESRLPPQRQLSDYEFTRLQRRMDAIMGLDPSDSGSRMTALRILLFDIFTRHFADAPQSREPMPLWLEEVCAAMRRDGNFIQGTARFFSLTDRTREHVSRTMKRCTGQTVSEYVNDLRLNYIANMLRSSNHSVTQIIFESGFNNVSWACQLFREKYGMTMSQYRIRV